MTEQTHDIPKTFARGLVIYHLLGIFLIVATIAGTVTYAPRLNEPSFGVWRIAVFVAYWAYVGISVVVSLLFTLALLLRRIAACLKLVAPGGIEPNKMLLHATVANAVFGWSAYQLFFALQGFENSLADRVNVFSIGALLLCQSMATSLTVVAFIYPPQCVPRCAALAFHQMRSARIQP